MRRSDFGGAAISLGAHAGLLLVGWALVDPPPRPPAPPPAPRRAASATRVALYGHKSALQVAAPAPAAPVVLRHRGPLRRQVTRPTEPQVPQVQEGAPALGEAVEPAPAVPGGEGSAEGDGLLGVLGHSSDALGGDPAAAGAAEAGARAALEAAPKGPDLTRLNASLAAAAARCYPAAARRFHQTGVAVVEFCVDARGALVRAGVKRSSGAALLDEAATACVLPGALPAGPEVGAGCFTLPVRFTGGSR